jgi:hypothetical protein
MTNTTVPENVMKQIRNLLNKTVANGCTEAEAATAAALAQKMLMKWNLGMTDLVEDVTPEQPVVIGENFTDGVEGVTARVSKWKGALLNSVARANGCYLIYRYVHSRSNGGRLEKMQRMILIGQERDAAVTKALYEILRDTVEERCKLNQPAGLGRGEGKSWAASFKLGAVSAISERLRHTREEVKTELKAIHGVQENRATTALARIDTAEIALAKYIRGMHLKNRPSGNTNINHDAYERGRLVGSRISLSSKVLGA